MDNIKGFINSELRLPTSSSIKKKRYVTFICPSCNVETTKVYQPKTFVNKCPSCAKGAFTTTEFINIGKKKHGNKFDYSKTVYAGKRGIVIITCPIHGDFTQRAQEHMDGHGCFTCGNEERGVMQQLPTNEWVNRLAKHPNISFKDVNQITDSRSKVVFVCTKHGEFIKPLYSVNHQLHLCSECAKESHQIQSIRPSLIGTLASIYYAYLPSIDMYKLGVSQDVNARLLALDKEAVLIKSVEMLYEDAVKIENSLHNKLTEHRYFGSKKLIKNGNSELYKINVIDAVNRALQQ